MPSFNQVVLVGNLTRDPELRYTPGGAAVCEFGLAVNRKWKNKQTGEDKEEVAFIDCVGWGRTAELLAEYVHKGDPLLVSGRLTQDRWEDQQTGKARSKIKVTVETMQFLSRKGDGGGRGQEAPAPGQEEDIPF
jgi:single-strand DNA-binding protein